MRSSTTEPEGLLRCGGGHVRVWEEEGPDGHD